MLLLDPTQLMPEERLSTLLDHAVKRQLSLCKFHNCSDQRISLLFEHQCAQSQLPSVCQLTLQRHKDQVWFCSFSPSSPHRFATLSKDGALHLYSISGSVVTQDLAILSYLECLSLTWSGQSDAYLLVGARDNCAYLFSSKDGSLVMKTSEHSKGVQQAIFSSDDARVLVLGQD
jgi:WD40 repeat protein